MSTPDVNIHADKLTIFHDTKMLTFIFFFISIRICRGEIWGEEVSVPQLTVECRRMVEGIENKITIMDDFFFNV